MTQQALKVAVCRWLAVMSFEGEPVVDEAAAHGGGVQAMQQGAQHQWADGLRGCRQPVLRTPAAAGTPRLRLLCRVSKPEGESEVQAGLVATAQRLETVGHGRPGRGLGHAGDGLQASGGDELEDAVADCRGLAKIIGAEGEAFHEACVNTQTREPTNVSPATATNTSASAKR